MTTTEFQVQKVGLGGDGWKTVCRASEAQAREIFQRQLRLHSVGRFRLVDPSGKVVEERKSSPSLRRQLSRRSRLAADINRFVLPLNG